MLTDGGVHPRAARAGEIAPPPFRREIVIASAVVCSYQLISDWFSPSPAAALWSIAPMAFGLFLRTWALLYMGSRENGAGKVFTGGPFRVVRHPRYVGSLLILAGFFVLVGHGNYWLSFAAFLPPVFMHAVTSRRETDGLGDDPKVARWRRSVSPVFPVITPGRLSGWGHDDRILWSELSPSFLRRHVSVIVAVILLYSYLLWRALV